MLLLDDCFEVSSSESILSMSDSEFALIRLMTDFEMFEPRVRAFFGMLDCLNLTPPPTLLFEGWTLVFTNRARLSLHYLILTFFWE